jgi:hypothetical protein
MPASGKDVTIRELPPKSGSKLPRAVEKPVNSLSVLPHRLSTKCDSGAADAVRRSKKRAANKADHGWLRVNERGIRLDFP